MNDELAVLKACADATRLRILVLLSTGELCVCELVEILDMPQAKVSRHLAVLRGADLVRQRREGTWIHYSLLDTASALWRRLRAWLEAEARDGADAAADLARLAELPCRETICARQAATRQARPAGVAEARS